MKLYLYIGLAIAMASLLAYGVHEVKKANRTEAAEAALADERKAHKAQLIQVEKALAASILERQKLNQGLAEITRRFNSIEVPSPKTLIKTVQVPGEACPHVGVSDQFVGVYNAASSP
jgi:septal ring factor EnvC (AmiA/AmiB activator)